MATWMFDWELGCKRGPAPDLVPSIQTARSWDVALRGQGGYPLKASMYIHMGNVSGRETDKSEFEFTQHDPRQDWPEMSRWWRPLRNGIVKGEYVFKVLPIDSSSSAPQTLYYDDEVGTRYTFSTGDFWRDIYAPVGQSFDGAGGWRIFMGATNPSSTYWAAGLYDIYIANNDGTDNPVPGTEVLLRWAVSYNSQFSGDPPDLPYAAEREVEVPVNILPESHIKWEGPPVVAFMRDDYRQVYHNMFFYDATGGGSNYQVDWYEMFIQEGQRTYGSWRDGAIRFLKWGTYDSIYDTSFFNHGPAAVMMKVEYVSGDNVMEIDYGATALGEWTRVFDTNIVQEIDAVLGQYESLSGVFDITLARNLYPTSSFPYTFDPVPGSEQRRRIKFVTEYVADMAEPLPDLSPPFDPDYPASAYSPFEITLRTTSPSETVTLPLADNDQDLFGHLGHTFTVDWGDGSSDVILAWDQAEKTHTYVTPGDHEVSITGLLEGWQYDLLAASEALKLIEIRAWGNTDIRSLYHAFYGCANLVVTATDTPNLSRCANMSGMFYGCTALTGNFVSWQPRLMKWAAQMFYNCVNFTSDVSSWPVDNLEDASEMFYGATLFNSDLSSWNIYECDLLTDMLTGTSFSTENYDLLLNSWSQIEYLTFYRTLDVDVPYTIAVSQGAHDYLTGTVFWTLNDAGGV